MVHYPLALVPVSQVGVFFGKGFGRYKERVAFQPCRGAAAQPHIEDVESLVEAVAVDKHLPTCEGALVGLGEVLVEPIGIVLVERVGGPSRRRLVEDVVFQPCSSAAAQKDVQAVEPVIEAVAVDEHLPVGEGAFVGLGHVLVQPIGIVLVECVGGTCRRCLVEDVVFQPCRGAAAQKDVQAVEPVVEAVAVDEHLPVGEGALVGLGHVLVEPIGIVLVERVGGQKGWRDEESRALHPQGTVAPYQHIQGVEANGQVACPYLKLACGGEAIGDVRIVVVVEPINISTRLCR